MSLMTSTTTYEALVSKYMNFSVPTVAVLVDGTEIVSTKKSKISELSVELTGGFHASGATFTLLSEYDYEQSDFKSDGAESLLVVGASIEIKLGYIELTSVFKGLIVEINYEHDNVSDSPYIRVECMDAKCLLMKTRRLELLPLDGDITAAVNAVLGEQPVSDYISGKEVASGLSDPEILTRRSDSDYEFLVAMAKFSGCEFFIVEGKVYFRKKPEQSSAIMTLSPTTGIVDFSLKLSGVKLAKTITVVGIDANDAAVTGTHVLTGDFGKAGTVNKMLNNTEQTYYDPVIKTQAAATARAKAISADHAATFAKVTCTVVGIPELVPGRGITFERMSAKANKTFYITSVRHVISESGYQTTFEAQ